MRRQALPLAFTWLHQLEFRNAIRLRVFRGEITPAQRDASLNTLLADLAGGVLAAASPLLTEVMIEAERLSALHSETLGTRSLDILHVAAALALGLARFSARQTFSIPLRLWRAEPGTLSEPAPSKRCGRITRRDHRHCHLERRTDTLDAAHSPWCSVRHWPAGSGRSDRGAWDRSSPRGTRAATLAAAGPWLRTAARRRPHTRTVLGERRPPGVRRSAPRHRRAPPLNRAQPDLERDLLAGLAHAVHDYAAAHLPYLLPLHKFVALLAVPLARASGEESLDGAPHQFPARVSKQLFRTGIGKAT